MGSPARGVSPLRDCYGSMQCLREDAKGKEDDIIDLDSKVLPPICQLPEEILVHIFKYVAGSDQPGDIKQLCAIRSVCTAWYRISDDVLLMYWNKLRVSQISLLHSFSHSIERRIGGHELSCFFRFRVLTENFRRMGAPISDDVPALGLRPLQYVETHQGLLNASLEAIWSRVQGRIHFGRDPIPVGAVATRQWLNDLANAGRIDQITYLEFACLGLKMVPPEIGNSMGLQRLFLGINQLITLPSEIGNLTQLQELSLSHNQLVNLPPEIGNLAQLQRFDLKFNQLVTLPPEIGNLTQLQELSLSHNQLVTFPSEIGKLTRLQCLSLSNNKLSTLPPEVGNLAQAQRVYLDYNQLVTLPLEIGNLTQLQELYLGGNLLIFLFTKDLSRTDGGRNLNLIELAANDLACSNYSCQSSLAALCQGIHLEVSAEVLRQQFEALSPRMQQLISDKWAGTSSLSSSSFQVEDDLLANRVLFTRAVASVLREKFNGLSQEEKNLVYRCVWEFAGRPSEDSCWGEEHAEDNIIRLIDAMEWVTS